MNKKVLLMSIWLCGLLLTGCKRAPIVLRREPATSLVTPQETEMEEAPAYLLTASDHPDTDTSSEEAGAENHLADQSRKIIVHVCGAVRNPGVYALDEGARIVDAVGMAGGFHETADTEWCNQAMALCDGDKLKIYTIEETSQLREQGVTPEADYSGVTPALSFGGSATHSGQKNMNDSVHLVNLNTAGVEELVTLPGIGESRAKDIVAYRNMHGAFTSIEQIMEVSGIKTALFGKISELITI